MRIGSKHPSALVVTVLALLAASAPARAATTERISLSSSGRQANGESDNPSVSRNGAIVAFDSLATNLASVGDEELPQVFLRDRPEGTTQLVTSGGVDDPEWAFYPDVSDDGDVVAFDLWVAPSHGAYVQVHDVGTGKTETLDRGDQAATSGDGNVIGFNCCFSLDLEGLQVFVHERSSPTPEPVSLGWKGQLANRNSFTPALSEQGRYVAFVSRATNLNRSGDRNGVADVFVRDRRDRDTTRVSVGPSGAESNGRNLLTAMSAHGRFIAFVSEASNLVRGDTNGANDVFVRDREEHRTIRVSVGPGGRQGDGDSGEVPGRTRPQGARSIDISADGRFVAFVSEATNLVAGDTNGKIDVFVRDRHEHRTIRVSVDTEGGQANADSFSVALSGDGRFTVFSSDASNLVPHDTNDVRDIFIRGLG